MNEDREQLLAIRSQTLAQIQDVRGSLKPTYWIDGQRVHWEQYVESLQRTVDWCDAKLQAYEPYEVRSEGGSA